MPRARSLVTRCLLLAAATALTGVVVGCGGNGSGSSDMSTAALLDRPAATWSSLSIEQQQDAMRACRLEVAVMAAKDGGAISMPYASTAYAAVQGLAGPDLRQELDARLSGTTSSGTSLRHACVGIVAAQAASAERSARGPRVDFAAPIEEARGVLTLHVAGTATTLLGRVTPARGHLAIGPAPGHSRSPARATVTVRDGLARVRLAGVPRGVSYLQATVTAGGRRASRLLVVRRGPAERYPAPRTFVPMTLHGQGSRGIAALYVPRNALATVTTDGAAPLTVAVSGTLLLAHASRDDGRPVPVPAGRYRDLHVTATGQWAIRLRPAR